MEASNKRQDNWVNKVIGNPITQGIFTLVGCFIAQTVFAAVAVSNDSFNKLNYWILAGSFLLLFSILNAAGLLQTKNVLKYWSRSIYAYTGMVILTSLCAYVFSGLWVTQASSIGWIIFIITMCYVLFLIIVYMMRKILQFAEQNDLENPQRS